MKKIKSLPTILGLLILLIGVTAGVILISQGTNRFLRASPEIIPKQVKITNIAENSFTVSWITDSQTAGFVKYGSDKELPFIAKDERDEGTEESGNFLTHHVTFKELKSATAYYFKIFSGGKAFDYNGQEYQATTAPKTEEPLPKNDVAHGNIIKPDGSPAGEVIVYLSLANTTPQSTLTKPSGNWVIPLNVVLSADLTGYATYDQDASIEEIFVQGASLGTATGVAVTKNDSPMPTITLGQNFDFKKSDLAQTKTPGETDQITLPPGSLPLEATTSPTPATEKPLEIINPQQEEKLNTLEPEFLGTGPAGESLTIEVNSPTFNDQITINEDGTWSWNPPDSLSPGEHTITVTLADGRSLSRLFTVLAAEGSDLPSFTATPSATITPSPTVTPTPTVTPAPTITITPVPTTMPSTESGIPESATLTPTFLFFIIGMILISAGLLFNIFLKNF
ncbi:MAG TPA: fibronectin type III domain-containing protein [Nevskiaceae bacterium]|nr:fibronectin type III domain-containing protein [Nevskiaceae bacterium]